MKKEFIALSAAIVAILIPSVINAAVPAAPQTGSTISGTLTAAVEAASTSAATVVAEVAKTPAPRSRADMVPVRVSIPKINLDDPVKEMGILKNGEMAVPSGSTKNVGWWSGGTVPGKQGSAVFDAHVFAAFSRLDELQPGDDIYVTGADGVQLHFKVETTEVFKLQNLSADYLFSRNDQKRLTLITCAGQLTPDHSTYTHRLVVSAVLVE